MRDGLGFFYASRDMLDGAKSAARAASFGASWCAVLVESVDGRRQSPERVLGACEALRARDIAPILYTFPAPDQGDAAARHAAEIAEACDVKPVILDVEPYKGRDWNAGTISSAAGILRSLGREVAYSTFYRRRWGAIRFPAGAMYLQVYERVRDPDELARAVALFPGREIVACVGTYQDDARVGSDLANAERVSPRSIGVWSLATTGPDEGRALRRWAIERR
tara:strand:+ start:661 stop:1329 length:669 start_codon:yes stop_codon:yes gene_type:complete